MRYIRYFLCFLLLSGVACMSPDLPETSRDHPGHPDAETISDSAPETDLSVDETVDPVPPEMKEQRENGMEGHGMNPNDGSNHSSDSEREDE